MLQVTESCLNAYKELQENKPTSAAVEHSIQRAKDAGFKEGMRITHKWVGPGIIVGFNNSESNWTGGDRFPLMFKEDISGNTYERDIDEFHMSTAHMPT